MDRRKGRAAAPTTPASPSLTAAELGATGLIVEVLGAEGLSAAGLSAAGLSAEGLGHLRAERYLEAQICCQQALAIDPDHADTLHLMGLLSIQSQQYDHAVEWIARAIRRDPRPQYLLSLGRMLQFQGRHEDALKTFDKAVQLKPDDAELWKHLGNALVELKRPQDALLSFQQALKLNPRHCNAAYQCGLLLREQGQLEAALSYLDLAYSLQPDQPSVLELRAALLFSLQRFEEALADSRRAHALNPDNADTCNNIGTALQWLGRDEEALPWLDRALELRPDYIAAFSNKMQALQQLRRFDEAVAVYHRLKAVDPDNAAADLDLAFLHLLTGNFEAGWAGYEARWRLPSGYPKIPCPLWLGEGSLEGKTILLGADEGLGDAIQFARYVPMVAARGAQVVLLVKDPLVPLLAGLPGVSRCVPISAANTLPAFDVHCPLSSLPLAFGTRLDIIPSGTSYLPPPEASRVKIWEQRLGPHDRLRVGLAWSGNPDHKNDHNRSSSLRAFSAMFDVDATFVSLQKDPRPDDKAILAERRDVVDLTAHLTDFVETSALISCLDLVISVDTSVAHLAGALGRPTWILLPYTPDYRWLLDRDDSPWYPTVRLFRQGASRNYTEVIDRVRTELAAMASGYQPAISFDEAVRLGPDDAEHWVDLGSVLAERKRPSDAVLFFQRALTLAPRHLQAAWQCAVLLQELGRPEEALFYFDLCDELRPHHLPTVASRALVLRDLKRFEQCLAGYEQAYGLDPTSVEVCNNIGDALSLLGRFEEALQWLDRALELRPSAIFVLESKAAVFKKMHRFDETFATYDHIRSIDPGNAKAEFASAINSLLLGDYETGWKGREARWRVPGLAKGVGWSGPEPLWLGEQDIGGKTILVYSDEGFGDAIQFARYVPMLAARGARVVLMVPEPLHALLSTAPGLSHCLPMSAATLPAVDVYCPINSLPLAFKTKLATIPLPVDLSSRVDLVTAWEKRLGARDRLRVGLVWSGRPTHPNDQSRSIALQLLTRILDVDATFLSLQRDPRSDDKALLLGRADIVDLTEHLADFSETAALVECLDLVITVDTSVAHLAGTMGCPTWVLLPYTPDHRWLLDRDDSPWYPTVRLFRQGASRNYTDVIDRVRTELAAMVSGYRSCSPD
jgi:tetratricopeptide (TPR) repeat protein